MIFNLNTRALLFHYPLALTCWFALCINAFAQDQSIRVESSFKPSKIALGNNSMYKVVIHGTQENPEGSIPSISGLNLSSNPQTFRSASFINGVPSIRLELSFQARPSRRGNFTIPSWTLSVGGKSYSVPPSTLQVLAPNQQSEIEREGLKKQEEELKNAAFIEFSSPRSFLFEGESVNAQIKLFLWDRLPVTRIEQAPVKIGDAFSMTELFEPNEQRNFMRDGKSYSVYNWPIGITGAISGNQKLSFTTSIRVRTKNRTGSPFNNPFFNDPFFGFGREESIQVVSEEISIDVRPLPINGRPPGFQGAIGSFTTKSYIDSERVSLGDPVRLSFELTGKGNFEAMPAPKLASSKNFKVGPPSFSFSANSQTALDGTQSFEYVLTPLTAGLLEVPTVNFSYFDPIKEKFFSIADQSHQIRVDPGEKWIEPEVSEPDQSIGTKFSTSDLFQTESEPGEWESKLTSGKIYHLWGFWIIQGIPFCGACSLIYFGRSRRRGGKESVKYKENQLIRKMHDCASRQDGKMFFRHFRSLVQLKVGTLRNHPNPSSLSSVEVLSLIKQKENDRSVVNRIDDLLLKSDDQEFANEAHSKVLLLEEYKKAVQALKKLK